MSYFGNSSNNDPFASNSMGSFNAFLPPQPPKKSNKGLIIALASVGGILLLAGLATGAWLIISNLSSQNTSTSSAGEKLSPDKTPVEIPNPPVGSGDPALDNLNASGQTTWSQDAFGYTGSYAPLATYLSDQGSDDSSCALWIYENKSQALAAAEGGDFDQMTSGITWGESNDGSFGYVLVSDSQTTECATQAFKYLGF